MFAKMRLRDGMKIIIYYVFNEFPILQKCR